jgi:hypothetical protein
MGAEHDDRHALHDCRNAFMSSCFGSPCRTGNTSLTSHE